MPNISGVVHCVLFFTTNHKGRWRHDGAVGSWVVPQIRRVVFHFSARRSGFDFKAGHMNLWRTIWHWDTFSARLFRFSFQFLFPSLLHLYESSFLRRVIISILTEPLNVKPKTTQCVLIITNSRANRRVVMIRVCHVNLNYWVMHPVARVSIMK
jgi:hypothetical protein